MALITSPGTESAADFLARLQGAGLEIKTGEQIGIAIAYSANSLILRQKQTKTDYEYRGLDQSAAEKLATLSSDTTTTTVYYKSFGSNGDCAVVGIPTGTKIDYIATRDGESRMWSVRKTVDEYAVASSSGWSTTRPANSGNGVILSKNSVGTIVARVTSGSNTYALVSIESTTVTRYRFRTYTEANTLVSNNTYDNTRYADVSKYSVHAFVLDGSQKSAHMQYVDGDYGFTVDVTEKNYTHTGW